MTKAKAIPFKTISASIKENRPSVNVCEWNGIEIAVKYTISLEDMLRLVNETVNSCSGADDGMYMPEVKQFAFRCGVISYYTNVSMPSKMEDKYLLAYRSGIFEAILPSLCTAQLEDIALSIDDKLDYICDGDLATIRNNMKSLTSILSGYQKAFDGIEKDDVKKLVSALGSDNALSEEKIVSAYIAQTKEAE